MSYNFFDDLLRDEGLDEAAIKRVKDALRAAEITVSVNWERRWKREAKEATERAAEAAKTMPEYHGAITRCQANVSRPAGRITESGRCDNRPTRVRRVRETHGSYKGDGRIAVCGTHARAKYEPSRWVCSTHWMNRGKPATADEIVEPEYQP